MRIACDLDDTLICCQAGVPREQRLSWLRRLFVHDEPLRLGAPELMRQQHNDGTASRYTRSRRPVKLVYREPQRSQSLALKREAAIKKLTRRQKLKMVRAGRQ